MKKQEIYRYFQIVICITLSIVIFLLPISASAVESSEIMSSSSNPNVVNAQQWLNTTYTGSPGFTPIIVDGVSYSTTFMTLVEAFQIELGFPDYYITGVFGSSPTLSEGGSNNTNMVKILQHALLCKGYYDTIVTGVYDAVTKSQVVNLQEDAGLITTQITESATPMVLQAALSTEIYILGSGGDPTIRNIQRKLNETYLGYIGIQPCDGIFGANTCESLIFALQAEEGIPTCTITVIENVEQIIQSVNLLPLSQNLVVGQSVTLTAELNPLNATYSEINWQVADSNVAVIEIGINNICSIRGVGNGTTTVTATISSGSETYTSTATINVANAITVHYYNEYSWYLPHLYYYSEDEDDIVEFPGVEMEEDEDDWYSFTIYGYESIHTAFTGGNLLNNLKGNVERHIVSSDVWYANGIFYYSEPEIALQKYLKGDVNLDGAINVTDILKIQNHILKIDTLSGNEFMTADTNEDGRVNVLDLMKIQNYILGNTNSV